MADNEPWYSVRCVFSLEVESGIAYEERVTVWKSASFEDAVERAEQEAVEYAATVGATYVGLAPAFHLGVTADIEDGDEVFSLVRDSALGPDEYLSRFFDTGTERQETVG